jgi:hypothetical protein
MTRVEHYKGLHTNIDKLYQEIKQELENEKNLRNVAEMKGDMNGKPLRSITTVTKSLVVLVALYLRLRFP